MCNHAHSIAVNAFKQLIYAALSNMHEQWRCGKIIGRRLAALEHSAGEQNHENASGPKYFQLSSWCSNTFQCRLWQPVAMNGELRQLVLVFLLSAVFISLSSRSNFNSAHAGWSEYAYPPHCCFGHVWV